MQRTAMHPDNGRASKFKDSLPPRHPYDGGPVEESQRRQRPERYASVLVIDSEAQLDVASLPLRTQKGKNIE